MEVLWERAAGERGPQLCPTPKLQRALSTARPPPACCCMGAKGQCQWLWGWRDCAEELPKIWWVTAGC